jgi:PilZ domain
MLKQPAPPSRRFTSRVETPEGVWVDWRCAGYEDISRVRNISLGGLYVETPRPKGLGSTVKLEFLVQEGQIRADAVIRRVEPGHGLALRFTAVIDEDRSRLAALMNRLRQSS